MRTRRLDIVWKFVGIDSANSALWAMSQAFYLYCEVGLQSLHGAYGARTTECEVRIPQTTRGKLPSEPNASQAPELGTITSSHDLKIVIAHAS